MRHIHIPHTDSAHTYISAARRSYASMAGYTREQMLLWLRAKHVRWITKLADDERAALSLSLSHTHTHTHTHTHAHTQHSHCAIAGQVRL